MPVITIAREFGAGGAEVGAILASRLGVDVVDRSLIIAVAGRLRMAPEEVEAEDEHPRAFFDRLLRAVTPINDVVGVPWDPSELESADPHQSVVELTAEVIRERGSAQDPLGWDELVEKYRDCASRALPKDQVERSLDLVSRLEDLRDIRDLVQSLVQS